jgi:DNA-binding PadR family transcriptional regulator
LLDTVIGEPTAKRGGKAIKYYRLTPKGIKSLEEIKRVQDVMWEEFNNYALEKNS